MRFNYYSYLWQISKNKTSKYFHLYVPTVSHVIRLAGHTFNPKTFNLKSLKRLVDKLTRERTEIPKLLN